MKLRHISRVCRFSSARALTLIKLLAIVAPVGLLAWLSIGSYGSKRTAERNRTTSTLQAIIGALERYKEEHGEYPASVDVGTRHSLRSTSGAAMLYQVITGDGNDQIAHAASSGVRTPSSGKNVSPKFSFSGDFIPSLSDPRTGTWTSKLNATKVLGSGTAFEGAYLIDGYGHPFQYERAAPPGQTATTVNPTYDLWSYGEASPSDASDGSLTTKDDSTKTSMWIKNW